jgi:hypothetical protein
MIQAKRTTWMGHVSCLNEGKGAYKVSMGKTAERRPVGKPTHKWENNIKTKEICWEAVHLIDLA